MTYKKHDETFKAIYNAYIECLNCKSPGRENCPAPCQKMVTTLLALAEKGISSPDCPNCYYWEHVDELTPKRCDTCRAGFIPRIRNDLNELELYRKVATLHVVKGWAEKNTPYCMTDDGKSIKCQCGQHWNQKICNFTFCPDCGQRIKELV